MAVVADTSPLNYLILIGHSDLLPSFFGPVLIPQAVHEELTDPEAPTMVRAWMQSPPSWFALHSAPATSLHDRQLASLDPGEREAIRLAVALRVPLVLIDEAKGRREAMALHLTVKGNLGILELAAQAGRIDLLAALQKLDATNFRLAPLLRDAMLERRSLWR